MDGSIAPADGKINKDAAMTPPVHANHGNFPDDRVCSALRSRPLRHDSTRPAVSDLTENPHPQGDD